MKRNYKRAVYELKKKLDSFIEFNADKIAEGPVIESWRLNIINLAVDAYNKFLKATIRYDKSESDRDAEAADKLKERFLKLIK